MSRPSQGIVNATAAELTWPQVAAVLEAKPRWPHDPAGSVLRGVRQQTIGALARRGVVVMRNGRAELTDLGEQVLIVLLRNRLADISEQVVALRERS